MKQRLSRVGLLALFWIGFFIIARVIFLLYHVHQASQLTFLDIVTVFVLGLRMDLAMTGYWLILPCLLLCIPSLPDRVQFYAQNTITLALIGVSTIISVVDLELYAHWGFRMNTTPLFYIGRESLGSVNPGALVVLIVLMAGLLLVSIFVYLRWIAPGFLRLGPIQKRKVPLLLLFTASLLLPIRSSITVAPLNSGVVYFHKTLAFPNHAGINVTWNFFNSLVAQNEVTYPSNYYNGADPAAVLDELTRTHGPALRLFRQPKPNIVLIIMESFTSKIIGPLGGLNDVTPQLNSMVHEGVLFDHFYSSGDRTDKGLVAILSGFPAQPLTSIIKFPEKTGRLPYLPRFLQLKGYRTSFVYGGDIGFANMESYLTTAGFSHITEDGDFQGISTTKWGLPDHDVFQRLLTECDTASTPFFKVMLSLSSHEPFDVPMQPVFQGTDERTLFLNACYYADKSLGEFIQQARKEPWWDNTVIIITADHGHHYPNAAQELNEKDRFSIPLLILGGALAKTDTIIHTIGSQTDLANTLLSQVDTTHRQFLFSKDILARDVNPFAVYIFHNGYGFVDTSGETVYDFDFNNYVQDAGAGSRQKGSAFMQVLFNEYNSN